MKAYFMRLESGKAKTFTGGIAWIDRQGVSRISTQSSVGPPVSVADRSYFKAVVSTGAPFVSEGLVTRNAKPAGGDHGGADARQRAVGSPESSSGALELRRRRPTSGRSTWASRASSSSTAPAPGDARELRPPKNAAILPRIRNGEGVLADVRGLDGRAGRVVAYANSKAPGWTTVIDRPALDRLRAGPQRPPPRARGHRRSRPWPCCASSAGLCCARDGSMRRSGSDAAVGRARSVARRRLRDRRGVAGARSCAVRPRSRRPGDRRRARGRSLRPRPSRHSSRAGAGGWQATTGDPAERDRGSRLRGERGRRSLGIPSSIAVLGQSIGEPTPARRSLYGLPLMTSRAARRGSMTLLLPEDGALERGRGVAGRRPGRSTRRGRSPARAGTSRSTTSRSRSSAACCPRRCPSIEGLDFAGRYSAGGVGLEVGGDWYDALRRPDGIVHLTVGDVAGRGIAAAVLMGQLRNAFRALAYEHTSPAEIAAADRATSPSAGWRRPSSSRSTRTPASSRTPRPAIRRRCSTTSTSETVTRLDRRARRRSAGLRQARSARRASRCRRERRCSPTRTGSSSGAARASTTASTGWRSCCARRGAAGRRCRDGCSTTSSSRSRPTTTSRCCSSERRACAAVVEIEIPADPTLMQERPQRGSGPGSTGAGSATGAAGRRGARRLGGVQQRHRARLRRPHGMIRLRVRASSRTC